MPSQQEAAEQRRPPPIISETSLRALVIVKCAPRANPGAYFASSCNRRCSARLGAALRAIAKG